MASWILVDDLRMWSNELNRMYDQARWLVPLVLERINNIHKGLNSVPRQKLFEGAKLPLTICESDGYAWTLNNFHRNTYHPHGLVLHTDGKTILSYQRHFERKDDHFELRFEDVESAYDHLQMLLDGVFIKFPSVSPGFDPFLKIGDRMRAG